MEVTEELLTTINFCKALMIWFPFDKEIIFLYVDGSMMECGVGTWLFWGNFITDRGLYLWGLSNFKEEISNQTTSRAIHFLLSTISPRLIEASQAVHNETSHFSNQSSWPELHILPALVVTKEHTHCLTQLGSCPNKNSGIGLSAQTNPRAVK